MNDWEESNTRNEDTMEDNFWVLGWVLGWGLGFSVDLFTQQEDRVGIDGGKRTTFFLYNDSHAGFYKTFMGVPRVPRKKVNLV